MKKHILTLIIGMLIGAIITTGMFLILKSNTKTSSTNRVPNMNGSFNETIENNREIMNTEKETNETNLEMEE